MEVPNNKDTKQQPTITCLTRTHIVTCLCTLNYGVKQQLTTMFLTQKHCL